MLEMMWANPHCLNERDVKLLIVGQENDLDLTRIVSEIRRCAKVSPYRVESIILNKDELTSLDVCGFHVEDNHDGTHMIAWEGGRLPNGIFHALFTNKI